MKKSFIKIAAVIAALAIITAGALISVKALFVSIGNDLDTVNGLLDTHPLEPSDNDGYKNILICGSDKRPMDKTPGYSNTRTDLMMLISVENKTHTASFLTLPRDVIVKNGDSKCKLNEVLSYSGDAQTLVNVIKDSFALQVDEVVILNWQNFVDLYDVMFAEGITVDLTELEKASVNYVINTMNFDFGYERPFEYCFEDPNDSTGYFGFDQLAFMKCELNLVAGTIDDEPDGQPIDGVGHALNIFEEQSTYLSSHMFNANRCLRAVGYPEFSEAKKSYSLNSHQMLGYLRMRSAYVDQDSARQRNMLNVAVKGIPQALVFISSKNERARVVKQLSAKDMQIYTSYSDISDLFDDISTVRNFELGKVVDGYTRTSVPYFLNGNYKEQTARLFDVDIEE